MFFRHDPLFENIRNDIEFQQIVKERVLQDDALIRSGAAIDQHRHLVDLVNKFEEASRRGRGSRVMSEILNDLVGYGPDPNECIDLIRRTASRIIAGNHDHAGKPEGRPGQQRPAALPVEAFQDGYHIKRLHRNTVGPSFMDGVARTERSGDHMLAVIARNSTFSYKGQQVKVRQVAEELGVRYILEGSAVITPENEEPVTIKTGDLVVFPRGMKCIWKVIEPIEKHYKLD